MRKVLFLMAISMILTTACKDTDSQFTEKSLTISKDNLESNGGEYSERYIDEKDGTIYLTFKNDELNVVLWKTYKFNMGSYLYSISNNTIMLIDSSDGKQYSLKVSLKEQGEEEKEIYLAIEGGSIPKPIKQKAYVKNKYPLL